MDPSFFHQDPRKQPPPATNPDVENGKKVNFPGPQAVPPPSGHQQEGPPSSASRSVSVPTNSESATGKPTGISSMEPQAQTQKHDTGASQGSYERIGINTAPDSPMNVSVANHSGIDTAGPALNAPGGNNVNGPHGDQKSFPIPEKKEDVDMADVPVPVPVAVPAPAPVAAPAPAPALAPPLTAPVSDTIPIFSAWPNTNPPVCAYPNPFLFLNGNAKAEEPVGIPEPSLPPMKVSLEEPKAAPKPKPMSAAQAAIEAVKQFRDLKATPAAPSPGKVDHNSPAKATEATKSLPAEVMPPPPAPAPVPAPEMEEAAYSSGYSSASPLTVPVPTPAPKIEKKEEEVQSKKETLTPSTIGRLPSDSGSENQDSKQSGSMMQDSKQSGSMMQDSKQSGSMMPSSSAPGNKPDEFGRNDVEMEGPPVQSDKQSFNEINGPAVQREKGLPPAQNMHPPHQNSGPMNHPPMVQQQMQDPPSGFGAMRELKVEDALNYLDKVKLEFGDRPRIYNEFLEIMKNFKAHEIDTPGVIMRVSDLFRGYNNLILGFNTFLPDGFKISIKDLIAGGRYASKKPLPSAVHKAQRGNDVMMNLPQLPAPKILDPRMLRDTGFMHGPPHPIPNQIPPMLKGGENWGNYPGKMGGDGMVHKPNQNQGMQGPPQQQPSHNPMTGMMQQHAEQNAQQQGGQDENPAIEFDHAITYVTTIKKRFATEPRTYQQFLEILHTYQKEQRGIREVLEQVSSLFADHPDLLKQFTYFLPEAVQEQAKERLHAAAAEAEARQAAAKQRTVEPMVEENLDREEDQEITIDMTKKQAAAAQPSPPPGNTKRPSSPSNVTLQYPMMPETMIYNAGVERQFFDLAKESLRASSREGDLAWAEFLKCMDLYAQEILSKNEMLRYMEDLLGKSHVDLFEEFKRILSAAGAAGAPSHDDAWHSVPLSEIDFSRCRRCTPSYRALPRDYPVAPFSGRSEEEATLLNDVWISLPDGSEESYTFRHMRKNQHEEVLFRCEDERFEIDMVIDSTATALKRLEPIAEEIAILQQKEAFSEKSTGSDGRDKTGIKNALESGGLGGKTIKYAFDKSILNTIHRHAIARVYGDSGQEILDLMHKNPVVAIPVVVKRLKQKDRDFRAARDVLNRRWKELAEINYYKSIDHRSLTWRTIDKRGTSTRTLVAEIKDRAAHNGLESEVTVLAKRDKAKEEFGSFYEKTMGRYLERKMDLTYLPKPALSIFTPHYSMRYDNNSWAQRDSYRILSFALERGATSPGDKERCHRLWTDFLAPFLDLGSIWMQSPAVAYAALPHHRAPSIVSDGNHSEREDDESSAEEESEMVGDRMVTEEDMKDCSNAANEPVTDYNLLDNQPIPSGAFVSTVYGDGIITEYRSLDKSFVVSLPFGAKAYLNRNSVLCTILPVDPYDDLEHPIETDEDPLERDDDKFMLGPQSLYLFFRLHQVLIKRLNIARKLAFSVDKDQSLCTLIEHMTPDGSAPIGQKRYDAYLSLVYGLLEGGYNSGMSSSNAAEGGKYEDRVRCLLGHSAYELATMDKLVSHILKHLQNLANDDTMQGMIQIFKKQMESGGFKPLAFRQEAAMISEGENVFAFQYCHISKSDSAIMHVELVGCITDEDDDESMASVTESQSIEGPPAKKLKR